jgi:hypothetical protein
LKALGSARKPTGFDGLCKGISGSWAIPFQCVVQLA